jgi:HlyD family secretion protein
MVLSMAQMFGPGEAMAQTAIAGMVRQSETRLSPMIGGRLASISVTPGQRVRRGDVLAIIDNPELAASVVEARAAVASVAAERARVLAGSRDEDIAIARQAAEAARTNLTLAEQFNARITALAARNVGSRAQVDESSANLAKAHANLALREAELAAAEAGPVTEERALLDARLALANASLADLEARFDKTRLTAPIDGTIGMRIVELGEIVPAGRAVLTMIPDRKLWLGFTLREDALQGLAVGQAVTVRKADGSLLEARVTELRPLGEFATWRAARAVGDRDLSSFRLRLEPLQHDAQIEPGMTVWLPRRP